MGHQGIAALKIHGYDYLPVLVSQANDEGGENGEASETEKDDKKELLKFSDVLDQTTVGILIGGVIAVLALTGSGG